MPEDKTSDGIWRCIVWIVQKTGDQMNLPLLIGIMIAVAFAAIITVCTKRQKRSVK